MEHAGKIRACDLFLVIYNDIREKFHRELQTLCHHRTKPTIQTNQTEQTTQINDAAERKKSTSQPDQLNKAANQSYLVKLPSIGDKWSGTRWWRILRYV